MSLTASSSPPTGLMPRFSQLIEMITWGLGDSLERQRRHGWGEAWLAPLAGLLRGYLARTLARFTALHASFLAGTLPAPRPASARPASARPTSDRPRAARRAPAIPPGPVFIEYGMRPYDLELGRLLDDPEMRAFLAAVPRAGRLLRPLWRKLTTERLPEVLRLPPRPRRPRPPQPARPAAAASGPPGLRRVRLSDGTTAWEPIPCYPFSQPPPRTFARATEPPAPAPPPAAPPPAARPADWGRPAPPERPRIPWAMGLFQR